MSDEQNGAAAAAAEKPAPQMQIRTQFTRGLTFRNPGAMQTFETQPTVTVNIHVDAAKSDDENYLVGLRIEVAAKAGEQEVYAINLDYAGLFRLTNVEPRSLEPILLIESPRILFPFARRIISDVTRDAGYTPLMLDPVDFVALYRREVARRAAEQQAGDAPAPAPQA